MQAVELMDSRKFMALMDSLIEIWRDPLQKDEAKSTALQAVLDMAFNAMPVMGYKTAPVFVPLKPKFFEPLNKGPKKPWDEPLIQDKPKRTRRTKAQMAEANADKTVTKASLIMSPKEKKAMALKAEEMQAKTVPATAVLSDFIKTKIIPEYNKGLRKFNIPEQYKNRILSVNHENWENAFRQEGIPFGELDWSYPTTSVENSGVPDGYWPLAIK